MLKWIKSWFQEPPKRHFVFPILSPAGGKLRDHHVWLSGAGSRTELEARKLVMLCYDTSAFIIGPATEIHEQN